MWSKMTAFLQSWQGKALAASAVFGLAVYCGVRSFRKTPPASDSSGFVKIDILSRSSLIEIMQEIRRRYSKGLTPIKQACRRRRRKHQPDSIQYRDVILDFHSKAQVLLQEKSSQVFADFGVTEEVINHSFAYYVEDTEIEEAKGLMNEALNYWCPVCSEKPEALTQELTIEIFEYYRSHLVPTNEDDMDEYLVLIAQIDDEIFRMYGFEAEEIEKAYEAYEPSLKDISTQLTEQTRLVMQQTVIDSFEDTEATLQE